MKKTMIMLIIALLMPFKVSAVGLNVLPLSVGNHTTYGGGHSGGSGGFSGGSFSGGSPSFHFGFFGGLGGMGRGAMGGDIIGIIILVIIIALFIYFRSRRSGGFNPKFRDPQPDRPNESVPGGQPEIVRRVTENDPDFSAERFLSWSKQVFVQLQEAWTERDWKKARPFEAEELFNLHKSQLEDYIRNGTINIMENVCANDAYLCDYTKDSKFEYLSVMMDTRYNDYIIKEDTREVIKGDPKKTYFVKYKLKFKRTIGVHTGENSNASTTKCPNCGAPVDVNAAGQCAYCGTVITNGSHDWVLNDLEDIEQR